MWVTLVGVMGGKRRNYCGWGREVSGRSCLVGWRRKRKEEETGPEGR